MDVKHVETDTAASLVVGYPGARKYLVITVAARTGPQHPWVPVGTTAVVTRSRGG